MIWTTLLLIIHFSIFVVFVNQSVMIFQVVFHVLVAAEVCFSTAGRLKVILRQKQNIMKSRLGHDLKSGVNYNIWWPSFIPSIFMVSGKL